LKFLATSTLDEGAADEMVNGLVALHVTDGAHEAGNPFAGDRLAKRDAAPAQEGENELKMLKLLDGDGVQFPHPAIQVPVFSRFNAVVAALRSRCA